MFINCQPLLCTFFAIFVPDASLSRIKSLVCGRRTKPYGEIFLTNLDRFSTFLTFSNFGFWFSLTVYFLLTASSYII